MKIEKDGVGGGGGGGGGGRGEENKIGSTVRWMIKRALKPYTVFFLSFFFFFGTLRSKDRILLRNTRTESALTRATCA